MGQHQHSVTERWLRSIDSPSDSTWGPENIALQLLWYGLGATLRSLYSSSCLVINPYPWTGVRDFTLRPKMGVGYRSAQLT
ncbi:hypothetical protein SCLCIDRAFT_689884 [Scleroderma citrinum Foug A]|uniref:Uncharacterized protein n=1 Tax=Scleroderma citrinum Foug A TaxID=1036808 RepID=A0A0C3E5Q3_9AGAM|nr:hypothetical protein SCLCIDRAFT_689884 [Scleroderma citrinum Foug A]